LKSDKTRTRTANTLKQILLSWAKIGSKATQLEEYDLVVIFLIGLKISKNLKLLQSQHYAQKDLDSVGGHCDVTNL
jgi:hypothetical protein